MNKSKFILQSIVVLIFDLLFRPFWPELMLSTVFILYMLIISDDLYNLIPWWTAVVIVFGVFSGLSIWFYVGIMFLIYAIVYISKKIISYSN